MFKLSRFWQELKRRKVFRVVAMYAATAFIILEVVDIVIPALSLPSWTLTLVIVLLAIGFPMAAIFSWVFDITPEGLLKTKPMKEDLQKRISRKPVSRIFNLNNLVVAILLIVICILIYPKIFAEKKINDVTNRNETSIAVLPLINLNRENENLEYFSDGVTQEIIDELAKIQSFSITAFSTTYQFKNHDKLRSDIAKELNVKYLIQGSAKVYRDSVWLSIELFNPSTNERVWNGKYSEVLDNAPSIQASIARQVAQSLDVRLSSEEINSLRESTSINGEAFKLFLQAKAEITKLSEEGFKNTRSFLQAALALDPEYAQAHTLMAWNYLLEGGAYSKADNLSAFATINLAMPHIDKAIELDPESSDIYLVRGNLHMNYTGLLKQAKDDVEYALELNSWPKIPTNYCICTVVATYIALGEFEKAGDVARLAKEVDPGNVFIYYDEAVIAMAEGDFQKAQQLLEKAVDISNIPYFNFYLGMSYYHGKNYVEAINHLQKASDADGKLIALAVAYLSNAYFMLNDDAESERYREELVNRQLSGEHHTNLPISLVAAARKEPEKALFWLKKAQENIDWGLTRHSAFDPLFNSIKNDPEFVKLRENLIHGKLTNPGNKPGARSKSS